MFQELFNIVNNFIEKFNEITKEEELTKIAVNALTSIQKALQEKLSPNMEENEKTFDEIMEKPGLWQELGKKIKKAAKNKKDLLKFLLYLTTIMNEFDMKFRQRQKEERKNKEFDKIIKKYTDQIKEILADVNLTTETKDAKIKELKKIMERELKGLEHDR